LPYSVFLGYEWEVNMVAADTQMLTPNTSLDVKGLDATPWRFDQPQAASGCEIRLAPFRSYLSKRDVIDFGASWNSWYRHRAKRHTAINAAVLSKRLTQRMASVENETLT
jgi:hypothetical protein